MSDQLSQYWSESPDSLLAALHSTSDGLSTDEARQHLQQFGYTRRRSEVERLAPLGDQITVRTLNVVIKKEDGAK
jgi:hypothetical protein